MRGSCRCWHGSTFPSAFVWGDLAAIGRSDATYAKHFYASGANRGSLISAAGNDLIWAGGLLVDAWPANPDENEYTHVQNSNVPTLLIGGNLDFATPPENATRELLPHLANGRQVVLSDLGHSDDFWPYEPAAGTRLINTYLDTGKVDTSLYTHNKVDFSPSSSQGAYAEDGLGAMTGFGLLTILSLLLMWRRAHKRGGFGRKASAILRSVYLLVLGLGGWFIGLIIVLVALPTVPLDSELMAVLSIGTPIGLGTYWAWVNRDRPARATRIGIWVALTRRPRRRAAGVQRNSRDHGGHHHDRRSSCRCEPRPDRPRRRTNRRAAGDRSAHRHPSAHRHSSGRTLTPGIRSRRACGGVLVAATCSADVRARSMVSTTSSSYGPPQRPRPRPPPRPPDRRNHLDQSTLAPPAEARRTPHSTPIPRPPAKSRSADLSRDSRRPSLRPATPTGGQYSTGARGSTLERP